MSNAIAAAQIKIVNGTRAVSIYTNGPGAKFDARLYVNCSDETLGTATLVARKFKTLAGAQRWASKVMGA